MVNYIPFTLSDLEGTVADQGTRLTASEESIQGITVDQNKIKH